MSTEASNLSMTSNGQTFRWQSVFLGYGVVMFLILLFGFFGNLFTILVLRQREHRKKSITPLMLNLAIADLIIVVFGYPAIINTNLNGELMRVGSPLCSWSGFINGITGLTSIATLTSMSGVVYQTIKKNTPNYTVSSRQHAVLIVGAWLYGLTAMLPPLLGWNRFVPGKAGFSCAPDWSAHDNASVVYIAVLITAGFFVPLMVIAMFLILTHRYVINKTN